jgi:cytochrome c
MSQITWIRVLLVFVIALAALFVVRLHSASGTTLLSESASAGHRLAEAWCKECQSIEAATAGTRKGPPDFVDVANRTSTTALSLKVFLQTSHPTMPNIIVKPDQADDLVNYILSLKRN